MAIIKNREKYNHRRNKYTYADYFHPRTNESLNKLVEAELYMEVEMIKFEYYEFYVTKHYNTLLNKIFGNWKSYPDYKSQIPVHIC